MFTVHYKEYKHIYHLRGFQFFVKVKFCDLKKIVSFIFTYCILGWRDFGNFFYTLYVVPNCCWTPIPEFHVLMLPLSLVTRPLKIWTLTLKWTKKNLFKPLWSLQQGGNVFFDFFLKLTIKWNSKKNLFWTFWKIKMNIIKKNFFKFSFCKLFFDVFRKVSTSFQKNYWFLRSLGFFEKENFAARDTWACSRNCRFF